VDTGSTFFRDVDLNMDLTFFLKYEGLEPAARSLGIAEELLSWRLLGLFRTTLVRSSFV
jgi:hypothetical protein